MTLIQDYFPSLIILSPLRPPSPSPLGINTAVTVFSLSLAERAENPARDKELSSRTRFLGQEPEISLDDNGDISQEPLHSLQYSSQYFFLIHLLQNRLDFIYYL